jgi:hypothetical protein
MAAKRTLWSGIVALALFAAAAVSFANNLGGVRDDACSIPALSGQCVKLGLMAQPADPRAARDALLDKVEGVWGNAAKNGLPACTTTLRYTHTTRGEEDFIVVRGADGVNAWESVGRVASAENGSIFTRTLTPVSETGTQWELRLEDDRLIQVDNQGVATPLVKCGG